MDAIGKNERAVRAYYATVPDQLNSVGATTARGRLVMGLPSLLIWEAALDAPMVTAIAVQLDVVTLSTQIALRFEDDSIEIIDQSNATVVWFIADIITQTVARPVPQRLLHVVTRDRAGTITAVNPVPITVAWHGTERVDASHHGIAVTDTAIWLLTPPGTSPPGRILLDFTNDADATLSFEDDTLALSPEAKELLALTWFTDRSANSSRPISLVHVANGHSQVVGKVETVLRRNELGTISPAAGLLPELGVGTPFESWLLVHSPHMDELMPLTTTWLDDLMPAIDAWWERARQSTQPHRASEHLAVSLAALRREQMQSAYRQMHVVRETRARNQAEFDRILAIQTAAVQLFNGRHLLLPRPLLEHALTAEPIDDVSWLHSRMAEPTTTVWFEAPVTLASGEELVGVTAVQTINGASSRGVWWLVRQHDDPTTVRPIFGLLDASEFEGLGSSAVAFAVWATWTPAPAPPDLGSLADLRGTGTSWRPVARAKPFRHALANGSLVGLYRLAPIQPRFDARHDDEERVPSGRSVAPHLRRAHWRRVRVGPRENWHYELRFVPGTFVRGHNPKVVVHRLPLNAAEQSPLRRRIKPI